MFVIFCIVSPKWAGEGGLSPPSSPPFVFCSAHGPRGVRRSFPYVTGMLRSMWCVARQIRPRFCRLPRFRACLCYLLFVCLFAFHFPSPHERQLCVPPSLLFGRAVPGVIIRTPCFPSSSVSASPLPLPLPLLCSCLCLSFASASPLPLSLPLLCLCRCLSFASVSAC